MLVGVAVVAIAAKDAGYLLLIRRTGESGGSTAGLPSTSYECVQGVLSFP